MVLVYGEGPCAASAAGGGWKGREGKKERPTETQEIKSVHRREGPGLFISWLSHSSCGSLNLLIRAERA